MDKVIVLCGSGELPSLIKKKLITKQSESYFISFLKNKLPVKIGDKNHKTINLGKIITELKKLKSFGYKHIILAGSISRPSLSEISPDINTIKLIPEFTKTLIQGGDNNLLKFAITKLEKIGFKILKLNTILPECFLGTGDQSKKKTPKSVIADIWKGKKILFAKSRFDIGQSIIIQRGTVVGIEAIQGTDNLIRQSHKFLKKGSDAILIKLLKNNQDLRADIPAIGLKTVKNCKKYGISGIAFSAHRTVFINKEKVIEFCNYNKLFLYGL